MEMKVPSGSGTTHVCQTCVYQLDKCLLPNCAPSFQPGYSHFENCYYNCFKYYNDCIIMESTSNKTPKEERENIHSLVIAVTKIKKLNLLKFTGITANDKATNNSKLLSLYLFHTIFTKM